MPANDKIVGTVTHSPVNINANVIALGSTARQPRLLARFPTLGTHDPSCRAGVRHRISPFWKQAHQRHWGLLTAFGPRSPSRAAISSAKICRSGKRGSSRFDAGCVGRSCERSRPRGSCEICPGELLKPAKVTAAPIPRSRSGPLPIPQSVPAGSLWIDPGARDPTLAALPLACMKVCS